MYRTWLHLRNRAINIRLVAPTLGRDFIPDPSARKFILKNSYLASLTAEKLVSGSDTG